MEIDGPTFVLKSGYFLLVWVKVSWLFFLIFEQILQAGPLNKMLALLNKKFAFVLASGFLAVLFSQYLKGCFFTRKTL